MAKKGALFHLIQSLTKAEKRYFKLFAQQSGTSKNYLRLFEAIDKQEAYDEAALKQQFAGETFTKQLHVTKIYLSRLILKSLRNFYQNWTVEFQLKDLLQDIEILFSKELFDACAYSITKVRKLAEQYEKFNLLLIALNWERKLILIRQGPYHGQEAVKALIAKEREVLIKMDYINRYWSLTFELYQYQFGQPGTVANLLQEPLLQEPDTYATSLQARSLYRHIRYAVLSMTNQLDAAMEEMEALAQELEQHPERIQEDPTGYITCLTNKTSAQLFNRDSKAVIETLIRTREVPEKYKLHNQNKVRMKVLLRTYSVEIELYRDTGEYAKGIELADDINTFLEQYGKQISPEYVLAFYFQFSYLYFMHGDSKAALRWLNKIFNTGFDDDVRPDIQTYARFLNLMIHFELDNITVLKYAVDTCRRYLRKKRNPLPFEQTLLSFFSKVCLSPKDEVPKLLATLYRDLFGGKEPQLQPAELDYIDFKSWIEKRLKNHTAALGAAVFPK